MKESEFRPYIRSAVRLVLDSVTYSNALPEWQDVLLIDYGKREAFISEKISAYLSGHSKPGQPTRIQVPRKNSSAKTWAIPSVNDQIVLQVCASALSRSVESKGIVDYKRVFSYAPNRQSDRLAFTEDQFSAWAAFKKEVAARSKQGVILQTDIEEAFRSIDPDKVVSFFEDHFDSGAEIDLLKVLLSSFAVSGQGLPLINESIFYLGNVYLQIVDKLFERRGVDFIRFVDDYRIFDTSRNKLEKTLEEVTRDLAEIGFRPNARKTRLGDETEYLEAIKKVPAADPDIDDQYISSFMFNKLVDPVILAEMVGRSVDDDHDITEGMGRFTMQSLRKLNLQDEIAKDMGHTSYRDHFDQKLEEVVKRDKVAQRLTQYLKAQEEWRFIWLIYTSGVTNDQLRAINQSDLLPVARQWVRSYTEQRVLPIPSIDELHDLNYMDAGIRLYGSGK